MPELANQLAKVIDQQQFTPYVSPKPEQPQFALQAQHDNLRLPMYALQAYDAINSGNFFANNPGTYERQPMMRPFSHGGAPMMALGFGLYDVLRDALTRHNPKLRQALEGLQIGNNIQGIMQTDSRERQLDANPR